jgi:hypothetical protein
MATGGMVQRFASGAQRLGALAAGIWLLPLDRSSTAAQRALTVAQQRRPLNDDCFLQ